MVYDHNKYFYSYMANVSSCNESVCLKNCPCQAFADYNFLFEQLQLLLLFFSLRFAGRLCLIGCRRMPAVDVRDESVGLAVRYFGREGKSAVYTHKITSMNYQNTSSDIMKHQ